MGETQVTQQGTVVLRGIHIPVGNVRAAMLETGGVPVSDERINRMLDRVLATWIAMGKEAPEALRIDAVPGYHFIPIKLRVTNIPTFGDGPDGFIYFAVAKRAIFNA